MQAGPELTAARTRVLGRLEVKLQRLGDAVPLGTKSVRNSAIQFNALCEGLGNAELRGAILP